MNIASGIGAKLGIKGTLECRDKDGNVLQTIEVNGAIPLEQLDLSVEQAQALIEQQEAQRGTDNRQ